MTSPSPPPSSEPFVVRGEGYGLIEVTGPDRARWLHGLVSNEVKKLRPGEGNYSLFLTGKGKMIAECWILCSEDRLSVLSRPEHAATVAKSLDSYLMMDDVTLTNVSSSIAVVGAHGIGAPELGGALVCGDPPRTEGQHAGTTIRMVAVSEFGPSGCLVIAPPAVVQRWDLPFSGDAAALDVLRIESGIPRWGVDMDSDTIPVEVGLESRAISYDKGCYVGQEIIARIKTYGEPAKRLWGIRWNGEGAVAPKTTFTHEGRDAGWVTSSAVSPVFGSISLGYVKRTEGKAGAEVAASDGRAGTVVSLPFAR